MRKIIVVLCLLIALSGISFAQDDALTPYEIALQRIEEAKQTGSTLLFLNSLELTAVPPEIGQLTELEGLFLHENSLTSLPPEIVKLANLEWLALSDNQLDSIPTEIYHLENLQNLAVWENEIEEIPAEIGKMSNLKQLGINNNKLREIPAEVLQLTQLKTLQLGGNQLTRLPNGISQLTSLCGLDLSNNQFSDLPREVEQMTWLLEDECALILYGNPFIDPSLMVAAKHGKRAMAQYLRHQAEQQAFQLRLLVVSGATGFGLLAVLVLGLRWRMHRQGRKVKHKPTV